MQVTTCFKFEQHFPVKETTIIFFPKYWDRQTWANLVDPDRALQNMVSDQGLLHLSDIHSSYAH